MLHIELYWAKRGTKVYSKLVFSPLPIHHTVTAYRNHGGKIPRILDLDTKYRRVFSFTLRMIYLGF